MNTPLAHIAFIKEANILVGLDTPFGLILCDKIVFASHNSLKYLNRYLDIKVPTLKVSEY